MHNLWFNWTEFIQIAESECSVYMNTKYSDWVDVCVYVTCSELFFYLFFTCARCTNTEFLSLFAHNNHSPTQFLNLF